MEKDAVWYVLRKCTCISLEAQLEIAVMIPGVGTDTVMAVTMEKLTSGV